MLTGTSDVDASIRGDYHSMPSNRLILRSFAYLDVLHRESPNKDASMNEVEVIAFRQAARNFRGWVVVRPLARDETIDGCSIFLKANRHYCVHVCLRVVENGTYIYRYRSETLRGFSASK